MNTYINTKPTLTQRLEKKGIKTKSKWTKKELISKCKYYNYHLDKKLLKKLTKEQLISISLKFDRFIETGKYYKTSALYSIDMNKIKSLGNKDLL